MSIKFIKCKNAKDVGKITSNYFIQQVKQQPNSIFVLATGSSPIDTYKHIIEDYQKNKTD
jgi:glucosamine-6-phosphate deaminase